MNRIAIFGFALMSIGNAIGAVIYGYLVATGEDTTTSAVTAGFHTLAAIFFLLAAVHLSERGGER